ncbi:MAG: histidine kinase [Bacteroidales bacterium]|nr:histidine kinase [Bacteroidales bacterium]
MDHFLRKKLKLYGLFWGAVMVVPSLPLLWGSLGITGHFSSFEEIASLWLSILPILILFLVHNFLMLPLIKRNKTLYFIAVMALIALFGIYCFTLADKPPGMHDKMPPTAFDPPSHRPARPAALMLGFGVLALIANYGADAIVENERKEQERRLLEIDNLRLQLEALRYQINPHFFLNTLNNIQALILIDPDKAAESIGIFSKMMQMILRNGNAPLIPLSDEVCFIDYLVALMRLRYTDNVTLETRLPGQTGNAVVQPMILTTFVENAFKHGISYKHPSSVRVQIELADGKIHFLCENTLQAESLTQGFGIGLENARKRLAMLYGERYQLSARSSGELFRVELTIPDQIDICEA